MSRRRARPVALTTVSRGVPMRAAQVDGGGNFDRRQGRRSSLDDLGVELRSGGAPQLAKRFGGGARGTIPMKLGS